MTFRDIFSDFNYNSGKYVDLKTNKIIRCSNYISKDIKKIPFCPINLDLKAEIQAIDYYISKNKDSEKILNEKKLQLLNAIKKYDELVNKSDLKSDEYNSIVAISNKIGDEIEELGIQRIEDYYSTLNYIEYLKEWCINNDIEFEKESYDVFVEQFKSSSKIIEWEKTDSNRIAEYIHIMDINLQNDCQLFSIKYTDFKHLLLEEKIVCKTDICDSYRSIVQKNGNWKPLSVINSKIRCIIQDFLDDYEDYYLVYNNTEKKYNYYDISKVNELFIFRIHECNNGFEIYIKKIML